MKISITKSDKKSYKKLIIITIVIIAAIIVASLVVLQSTERLHDYILYNVNNHYIDIDDGDTKVTFEQLNYESAIYRIPSICHDKYIEMELGESRTI